MTRFYVLVGICVSRFLNTMQHHLLFHYFLNLFRKKIHGLNEASLVQVLGTDSGGTREIVEHNVTGLLHPLGRPGTQVLARNLEFLLQNPAARQEMGMRGREKVEKMYLKKHMFQKFGEVLYKCMRIK